MRGSYYFVIVSHEDCPIFELAQPGAPKALEQKVSFYPLTHKVQIDLNYLTQFVAHASLDMVDENMWNTPSTYLKVVDRFNDWLVSAFVTPAGLRFLLLHEEANEERIRIFFQEVYEAYVRLSMNPFFVHGAKISSAFFQKKVQQLARKYFG
ncbi:hypothetical protein AAHC03_04615 [Spirometra sp. Aus1]